MLSIMPSLQLRFDYDTIRSDYDVSRAAASIRRDSTRAKMNMSIFRRSRSPIVVVSQSNRTHIVISITFVVVEYDMIRYRD